MALSMQLAKGLNSISQAIGQASSTKSLGYIGILGSFHKLRHNFWESQVVRGQEGGISIDADSGLLGYVLWCCGSRSWEVFTLFQIGSDHTVGHTKEAAILSFHHKTRKSQVIVLINFLFESPVSDRGIVKALKYFYICNWLFLVLF